MAKIIKVRGIFHDIYGWGVGFYSQEIAQKWNYFWRAKFTPKTFWSYVQPKDIWASGTLALNTGGGSIYMHPMDFTVMLTNNSGTHNGQIIGDTYYESSFEWQISELYEICKECAEFCGGSFTMQVSKEVETNDFPMVEYNEDTYIQECGIKKIR